MRRLKLTLCLLAALGLSAVPVPAASLNRACSVTGGSAQRLSTVMTVCGWTGSYNLTELVITNPDDAANDLYVGESDVSTVNGVRYRPGDSRHRRSTGSGDPIQATAAYLWVSSTQNVFISARSQ
jgi:hypothetical protein